MPTPSSRRGAGTPPVDSAFIALARSWMTSPATRFLDFVWRAYDDTMVSPFNPDPADLERSITQLLEPRIRKAMTGDEPFYVQHGPYERETMRPPPAQPPEYDLAFVFRADPRIMWPIEAKVLETPGRVANYVSDVKHQFLTCRYGPFSDAGAMLGYLLRGDPEDTFRAIAVGLQSTLHPVPEHAHRPSRRSSHSRQVPSDKPYPANFDCYHLILAFPNLQRASEVQ